MRRLVAAPLVTVLSATLLLAGCAGDAEPEPTPSASQDTAGEGPAEASPEDVAALDAVQVEGELGATPELTFEQPFDIGAPVARVDTEGDGDPLEPGQQIIFHWAEVAGDDGTQVSSSWDTGEPDQFAFAEDALVPTLVEALTGQNVGVRILLGVPGQPAVEATEDTPASEATPASLLVLEVIDTTAGRAEGEAVAPPEGLPLVTLADSGEPEIEVPAGTEEPTELVAQTLIEGTGPAVESGQSIRIHYKGWLWDGTLFDSSWNTEPLDAPIGVGNLIDGWDEGLVGKTVGSQVLLVVPSEMGYGSEGSGAIPPDSTLIFVVDILEAR